MKNSFFLIVVVVLLSAGQAQAANIEKYLHDEARKILSEGDRIRGEANKMRAEAERLNAEASALRGEATNLDRLWAKANSLAPDKYQNFDGRDKSQVKMRLDAHREDVDAEALRMEGKRLDEEAVRLWKLAAAVSPQAQKDLIDRFRACCKASGLKFFQRAIASLATQFGAQYRSTPIK
jgi:hypothetical protein